MALRVLEEKVIENGQIVSVNYYVVNGSGVRFAGPFKSWADANSKKEELDREMGVDEQKRQGRDDGPSLF